MNWVVPLLYSVLVPLPLMEPSTLVFGEDKQLMNLNLSQHPVVSSSSFPSSFFFFPFDFPTTFHSSTWTEASSGPNPIFSEFLNKTPHFLKTNYFPEKKKEIKSPKSPKIYQTQETLWKKWDIELNSRPNRKRKRPKIVRPRWEKRGSNEKKKTCNTRWAFQKTNLWIFFLLF